MKIEIGMALAIEAAKRAQLYGQLPFGTIIVDPRDHIIGYGAGTETPVNPIRHSELVAIEMACKTRRGLLRNCTMFQTFEPCPMCCGAINHSKLSTVVVGCMRWQVPGFRNCTSSLSDRLSDTTHPPTVEHAEGELARICIALFDSVLDSETRTPLPGPVH